MVFTLNCHKRRPTSFYFPNNLKFLWCPNDNTTLLSCMLCNASFLEGPVKCHWSCLYFFISMQKQSSVVNCVPWQFMRTGSSGVGVNLPWDNFRDKAISLKSSPNDFDTHNFGPAISSTIIFVAVFKGQSRKWCVDMVLFQSSSNWMQIN